MNGFGLIRFRVIGTALLLALATMVGFTACTTAAASEPVDLVPESADVVVAVDLARVLADEDVQAAFGEEGESLFDEMQSEFQAMAGVDLESLGKVLVFANSADTNYAGFLASGEFNSEDLFAAIEENADGETETREHAGTPMLVVTPDFGDPSAVAVVDGDVLVAGTVAAVEDVLDVNDGQMDALTGDVIDEVNDLGDQWFKYSIAVPEDGFDEIMDEVDGGLGMGDPSSMMGDLGFVEGLTHVSGAFDKQGRDLISTTSLQYETAEQATEAEEVLSSLLTLAGSFGGSEEFSELLDGIETAVDGDMVTIDATVSLDTVEAALDSMFEGMTDMMM